MTERVLLLGGSGLLAVNWALTRRDNSTVILALHEREVELKGTFSIKIDTSPGADISAAIDQIRPDVIINTACLTSVELCEKLPDIASSVNRHLAAKISKLCADKGIKYVHISTDHLFSGESKLVTEDEPIAPRNVYGATKAGAEIDVLESNPDALVIRTNFYGWGTTYRHSFSDSIISSLRAGNSIHLFTDVFYTPILAEVLITTVHQLIDLNACGIFNIVGDDRVSKFEFGVALAKCFDLDVSLIKPSLMKDQKTLVQRPYDMSLSNKKVSLLLGHQINGIERHLIRLREQELSGLNKEIIRL